jgi:hypothetical protein
MLHALLLLLLLLLQLEVVLLLRRRICPLERELTDFDLMVELTDGKQPTLTWCCEAEETKHGARACIAKKAVLKPSK